MLIKQKLRMQVSKIINGWYHYLSGDTEVEKLANKRAKICAICPHKKESKVFAWVKDEIKEINGTICNKCSCPIAMKVRSINENCPINEW